MGCFLACFGFTKKRKRRKSSSKIISADQSYGRYVPLDSDVSVKLDIVEMPNSKISSDKPKESPNSKIRKKVSFNLNVKTYETLPNDEDNCYLSEEEEKTMWEYNQEVKTETTSILQFEEDSFVGSYPANYRYKNCLNSYNELDEIELEDSDFDDYLDSDEEEEAEEEERKRDLDQLEDSVLHEEMNRMEPSKCARNRSQNVCYSVLNPVENLTQWKEIKAKSRRQSKNRKENIVSEQEQQQVLSCMKKSSKPMMQGIAVDSSLSNWLYLD